MRYTARRRFGETTRRENVVPLINIVFLLLFFFMLTGTLRPPDPFPLELPETQISTFPDAHAAEIRELAIGAGGELALDGVTTTVERLGTGLRGSDPAQPLRIRADRRTPAAVLLPLLDRLRELGVGEIELATHAR